MKLNTIVKMKFGSHLYGLDTPQSDTDWKSIFAPTPSQLIMAGKGWRHSMVQSTGGSGKNTNEDVDSEAISIQKFIEDACSGQTYALDMLHCNQPEQTSKLWKTIVENRAKFYTKNMKSYVGYARKQAAKYGIKGSRLHSIRTAIAVLAGFGADRLLSDVIDELHFDENCKLVTIQNPKSVTSETYYCVLEKCWQLTSTVDYVLTRMRLQEKSYGERAHNAMQNKGVDFKALSHAIRAGEQVRCILEDGDFSYPLNNTAFIKDVKAGKVGYPVVQHVLENLIDNIAELTEASELPSEPDREFFEKLILEYYAQEYDFKDL